MRHLPPKGSVVLVALSCVTVLGIAMASFLAVSNQAMKLSTRSYAKSVSKQLAEMGLERALRSFNANTFSSGWTLDAATATATRTFTIASSRYGTSGITTSIKIRVDHYLDTRRATAWNTFTAYAVNDYVWHQGAWYHCAAVPGVYAPATETAYWANWKSAPESWSPHANYRPGNMVLFNGTPYICKAGQSHINRTPPDTTYWTASTVLPLSILTSYVVDDVVFSGGVPYRCILAHSNQLPPNTTYWVSAPVIYSEGVATLPDSSATAIKTQLRATLAPAALFPNAAGSYTYTRLASTGAVDSYNSVLGANAGTFTAGTYNQTTAPFSVGSPNVGSSAVLAGGETTSTAVAITNVRVRGYVAAPSASTAPYAPLMSNSTNGIVTNTATGTPSTKIDLTRVSRSPNVPQFDIQNQSGRFTPEYLLSVPSSGGLSLPRVGETVSTDGKYHYYTSGSLYLDTGYILTIDAPVVIDVRPAGSADLYIERQGRIIITANATASLQIHFGDELFIYSQNVLGGIQNLTLDPKRCILIGTSTYNSSSYHYMATNGANVSFYGVIYMPDAYLHIWNSSNTQNFYGALSAKNIYFNHATALHYDTSLRTAVFGGVDAPYEIVEWRELADLNERVVLP